MTKRCPIFVPVFIVSPFGFPEGMVLPFCPDNQRYVFTRPSSEYNRIADGRLYAIDVVDALKVLVERELRKYDLSPTERAVAKGVLAGATNKMIGNRLYISESMVKYHVRKILAKTGCEKRSNFAYLIISNLIRSCYSWRSRRDLECDMKEFQIL